MSTSQLFVASFASLVAFGTLGLRGLPGLYTGDRLGWLDAFFTATSAVCVTGLTLVDTATAFTPLGQAFLLLLIQLGGLGMITFTTLIILALGGRPSLRQERTFVGAPEVAPNVNRDRLIREVLTFTLALEAFGALALYALWAPRLGWVHAAWPALFHAVSAFCNAGFSTFSASLTDFQRSTLSLAVVMALVVAGGLGFLTLTELRLWRTARTLGRPFRLSLHSRLVLITTAVLIAVAWLVFAILEWDGVLRGLPAHGRLANALFLAVTPRTAGFNTIDYAQAADSTNFLTVILMFIGGSPASTAGGLKTTTVALLALFAFARLRGSETPAAWSRSVPQETVQRAVGLSVAAFVLVTASIFILTLSESTGGTPRGNDFLVYMFEAVSAFNTVGLSMAATPELSSPGRVLITLLMFVGRVGPITFAASLTFAARRHRHRFHYAYEDVVVG
ncbi:MAG: TrkH family potassium uptake protein [Longimicrobiales bacterium]